MKKLLSLTIAAVFALSLAGATLAQGADVSNATAPAKKVMKHKKTSRRAARARYVTGEVTAVDSTAGTITVKGRKGEVPLDTNEKTVIKKGKTKMTLADIKAGDRVTVRYSESNGKNIAKSIIVGGIMKKNKKQKTKKAAPRS